MAQLSTSNIDTQKQGDCSCLLHSRPSQYALPPSTQSRSNRSSSLQRVTPIQMHALLTALGARVASAEEVRALAAVHAAPDQPMAMDTSAPAVHVSAPRLILDIPSSSTLVETSSVWDMSAPSRPPTPEASLPANAGTLSLSDVFLASIKDLTTLLPTAAYQWQRRHQLPDSRSCCGSIRCGVGEREVVQVTLIVTRTALAPA
ncbi:hypothetical protein Hypma_000429 [Hypsizygus marmoreus]|uniref:Uncharacterized protein n=1 Tax=Hypsizygus marmoreus TaxID=39966 RepID=A0A369JD30_HYPMA|nr:hypothetical protein Hypma_000429 [Hypsizygus marmoreus]